MTTIFQDTRYWNPEYLNYSTVRSAITYDRYGGMMMNPYKALTKWVKDKSDAMIIGSIVDEHFTEWINFYETYKAVSRRSGDDETELTNSMYTAIDTIIQSMNEVPYMEDISFVDYSARFVQQLTLEDNELQIKGKLDFYDEEVNKIIDLKCTGSIDTFLKDMYDYKLINLSPLHPYVRQLAWYSYLVEKNYGSYPQAELLAVSHKWEPIRIKVPEDVRHKAFDILLTDIALLRSTIASGDFSFVTRPAERTTEEQSTTINVLDLI